MMRGLIALCLAISLALAAPVRAADRLTVESLLRTLLQVQDRIADGDDNAQPLQDHLLKLLDAGLGEIQPSAELSPDEFRALVIVGVVGKKSPSILRSLARKHQSQSNSRITLAVLQYRKGRRKAAIEAFSKIRMRRIDPALQPYLAFAQANLRARGSPRAAIDYYNLVRLSAPGTLLEEASLRRLMALHIREADGGSFVAASKQYVRRFLKSPYRTQFLRTLQKGVIQLRDSIPAEEVRAIGVLMPDQFAASFYMHTVRSALQAGHLKLADYVTELLIALSEENRDVQINASLLQLLKYLSMIADEDPATLQARLSGIDESQLEKDDQALLRDAKSIMNTVLAPTDEIVTNSTQKTPEELGDGADGQQTDEEPDAAELAANEEAAEAAHGKFVQNVQQQLDEIDSLMKE